MPETVSEYIFKRLAQEGVKDVFMVSGGGIMYLCEALGKSDSIRYWCNYNEQASAYAADGYARATGGLGVCLVTTGPGGTNALTGVAGAYVDSVPIVVISGQVRTQIAADFECQRQVGPQELNVVDMAKPVTKYAITVKDASEIRYELEKCIHLAKSGRPGPTWLCVPLDIQRAVVDEENLFAYQPEHYEAGNTGDVDFLEEKIRNAKRPLFIAGHGVAISGSCEDFKQLLAITNIPAVTTIGAQDILPEEHPQYLGAFGPVGQRRANFAVQNADFIIAMGTSLSLSCVGFDTEIAPQAEKVLVNIDRGELRCRHLDIQYKILADVKYVIRGLLSRFENKATPQYEHWVTVCEMWKNKFPPLASSREPVSGSVDIYALYHALSDLLDEKASLVSGNPAAAAVGMLQAFQLKAGQCAFTSVCFGAMGADIPHAIGAAVARPHGRTVLVTGDGSVLFNIQELMTVGFNKLPITICVLNNNGYQSIRNTQNNYFDGHFVGADATSGVGNPDFAKLADAFGLNYVHIGETAELEHALPLALSGEKPCICEIKLSQQQVCYRLGSKINAEGKLSPLPLHDIEPRLTSEELEENMGYFA